MANVYPSLESNNKRRVVNENLRECSANPERINSCLQPSHDNNVDFRRKYVGKADTVQDFRGRSGKKSALSRRRRSPRD